MARGGVGLGVQLGAAAVARALFSGNESAGVFVNREGAVTLSDVVVEGTREQAGGDTAGRGLSVQFGAMVEVTRALFSGNEEAGVLALGGGTSLSLSDVVIEDTQGRASDGGLGRALVAQSGPTVEVARALLSRNGGFGVLASGPGASMRLSDVVVEDTNPQVCARTTCPHRPFGVALAGISQAHLVATRFEARDSALCGVLVQEDAQVDLSLGQVSGSPIGVCLQVDDYAIPRLSGSVRYVDNETNLDATSLPVPEPVSEVQAIE